MAKNNVILLQNSSGEFLRMDKAEKDRRCARFKSNLEDLTRNVMWAYYNGEPLERVGLATGKTYKKVITSFNEVTRHMPSMASDNYPIDVEIHKKFYEYIKFFLKSFDDTMDHQMWHIIQDMFTIMDAHTAPIDQLLMNDQLKYIGNGLLRKYHYIVSRRYFKLLFAHKLKVFDETKIKVYEGYASFMIRWSKFIKIERELNGIEFDKDFIEDKLNQKNTEGEEE